MVIRVECDGCKASYQVDERRIPPAGLRMRCPKCTTTFVVTRDGAQPNAPAPSDASSARDDDAELPTIAAQAPAATVRAARAARPTPPTMVAPSALASQLARPTPPTIARVAAPAPPNSGATLPGLSNAHPEIDLPDVPNDVGLPVPRGAPRGFGNLPRVTRPGQPAAPAVTPAPEPLSDLPVHLPAGPGAMPRVRAARPPLDPTRPSGAQAAAAQAAAAQAAAAQAAAAQSAQASFGELDLPDVLGSNPMQIPVPPTRGAPNRHASTLPFGEIELPGMSPPSDRTGGAELPLAVDAAQRGAALPDVAGPRARAAPTAPMGRPRMQTDAGLGGTAAPAGLAVDFGEEVDLPTPGPYQTSRGFGEIDLPLDAPEVELPSPTNPGLPAPFNDAAELGAPAMTAPFGDAAPPARAFGGVALPAPYEGAPLPTPFEATALPAPAPSALPVVAPGAGLPVAQPAGLPTPAGSGLPAVAGVGLPAAAGGASLPTAAGAAGLPMMPEPGLPSPIGGASTPGGEIELAASLPAPPAFAPAPPAFVPPMVELPRAPSKARRYVIATVAVLGVAGGALALVPDIGPFGAHFILDRVQAPAHAASLEQLRARTRALVDEDTFASVSSAIADARATQASMPRYRLVKAYTAYLLMWKDLRFGRRPEDEVLANDLLQDVTKHGVTGDVVTLALAAQDAATGQLARARVSLGTLAPRLPSDVDVAALTGETGLSAKAPSEALAAFTQAAAIASTARTVFGVARAQAAKGDTAAAAASCEKVIAASPKHAGARILLASLTWQDDGHEQAALKLLSQVTDAGVIRSAASNPELVDAFTLLGRIHLARSRMSAAEAGFAEALKLDAQALQALIGSGEVFYESGRFDQALARFEAAQRVDADSVPARIGMAKTWLSRERAKDAKDFLKKLREAKPKELLVSYWLARAEDALGNRKEADAAYLDAIKIGESRPEVVEVYVAYAHFLSGAGRYEDAAKRLAEAAQKFPDSSALHVAQGEVALDMGRYEDAQREFEAALAKDDNLAARFKLGVTMRRMKRFEEATATFDKVATIDKDYPGLALERGLLFEETGQTERAIEMYAAALQKAPDDIDLKLRVGSAQVIAGHAKAAEENLRAVQRARPNSPEVNHFLGRALLLKGELSEALRYLKIAAEGDRNRAEYHLYYGWAANEAGQAQIAEDSLQRALDLDKNLGDAYWQRGILRYKRGQIVDALADLKTALEKRPSRFEAYATMALCDQDQQKWGEAEQAWRKAIAGDSEVADWHYWLGKLYTQGGNKGSAGPELAKAIELGDVPDKKPPGWLFDAHLLYAEGIRGSDREKAIQHYRRYLDLAPRDHYMRADVMRELEHLGVRIDH